MDIENELKTVITAIESGDNYYIEENRFPQIRDTIYPSFFCTTYPIKNFLTLPVINAKRTPIKITSEDFDKYINKLQEDFDRLMMALSIYLDIFVNGLSVTRQLPPAIEKLMQNPETRIHHILSFNYTDNISLLLGNKVGEFDICHIHGKSRYKELHESKKFDNHTSILYTPETLKDFIEANDMIMGFEDDSDDSGIKSDPKFLPYRKIFSRVNKSIKMEFYNWLDEYQNNGICPMDSTDKPNHIYIFGHSLGMQDKTIIKGLCLRNLNDTDITVYYHNEEAHKNMLQNLVQILTEPVFIEKTHKNQPDIRFLPTS